MELTRISGVILSAGDSSRMEGRPKALLAKGNSTFLETILSNFNAAGIIDVVVVLGRHSELIRSKIDLPDDKVIINSNPKAGQISSINLALERLSSASGAGGKEAGACYHARAAMIALVDMPYVKRATIEHLASVWRHNAQKIVIPRFNGKAGHPVILPSGLWPQCGDVPEGMGLNWVMRQNNENVEFVEVNDRGIVIDIDTKGDVERINSNEQG
ncbi:NTP transferase domain-containing protein [Elusimicrobiota bacterium]